MPVNHAVFRWLELVTLFAVMPVITVFVIDDPETWLMPLLVFWGGVCLYLLLQDPSFKRFRLWHTQAFSAHLKACFLWFLPAALFISVLFFYLRRDLWFMLPSHNTELWLVTLLIYPIISVLPQELIFRTYFFHRYKQIIPGKHYRLGLSAASFALAHAIYGNWIAVVVSLVGGLLFGYRYIQTRSTLIVVLEHSIWGMYLFTLGVGVFFLSGHVPAN